MAIKIAASTKAGVFLLSDVEVVKSSVIFIPDTTNNSVTVKDRFTGTQLYGPAKYDQFTNASNVAFGSLSALLTHISVTCTPIDVSSSMFCKAVTTNDNADLPDGIPRAIYVGGGGDITATLSGADVLFKNVAAGDRLPICPTRIKQSGTTATNLVAMY